MRQMRARREVLLCGGAINSPQLLQLSGIGPGAAVAQHGIEVVHDLPGVGENLQDHIGGRMIYRCASALHDERDVSQLAARAQYAGAERPGAKGALMTGAGPIGLFVSTRPELASPDVQYQFLAGSSEKTGDAMHRFPGLHAGGDPMPAGEPRLAAHHPADPARPPAIQPNYLSAQPDKETMVAGLRVIRSIFATAAMRQCVTEEYLPGPQASSDEDLLNHVRATAGTTFHQTSTCMMGPGPMAVVDASLRVKGMERLRVIDASIMPTVVSGNTNAPRS